MALLFKKPLLYIILFFLASIFIRLLYTAASYFLPFEAYLDVAICNTVFAVFAVEKFSVNNIEKISKSIIPALLVLIVSFSISIISYRISPYSHNPIMKYGSILIACLWIPIVEELVYRGLFSRFLIDKNHVIWSCYLSGLFFSINHSLLNLSDFPINMLSLPLGPFLLGAICQLLVLYSGSIIGAVFFHIACNMTVYIFLYNDNRWLRWLSHLYLSGN